MNTATSAASQICINLAASDKAESVINHTTTQLGPVGSVVLLTIVGILVVGVVLASILIWNLDK